MRPALTKSNQVEDISLEEVGQGDGAMVIPIEKEQQEADLVMEEFDEIVFGGSGDQENVPGAQIVHPWNYDAGYPPQVRHLEDSGCLVTIILFIYLICLIVALLIDIWQRNDLNGF